MLVIQRVERFLVSVLHAYLHRAGNYTCLLSNTPCCLPLIAFSLSSFNTTLTPAIRNNCFCFNSLTSGVKISQSEFLVNASPHHRFQFLIIGHRHLLMNFHVILFQYGSELIRLTYSQFVQKFPGRHLGGIWAIENIITSNFVSNS